MKTLILLTIALFGFTNGIFLKNLQFGLNMQHFPKNPPTSKVNVISGTLTQDLNHFNPQNLDTFEQKYLRIEEYYKPGGPIFILLGDQSFIVDYLLPTYHIHDIAKELNGLLFNLEHRYQGNSKPFELLTTENLQYLTADQALADIAVFIDHIKSTYIPAYANSSEVYLVGRHYAGGLAVWFRQKYPHLVTGAWASSATVAARVDNYEFYELTGDVYRNAGGNECYNIIERGFNQMDDMIANGKTAEFSKLFKLCNDIGIDKRDISVFMSYISQLFSSIIFASTAYGFTPSSACNFMLNKTETFTELEAIAELYHVLTYTETCTTVNLKEIVNTYSNIDPESPIIQFGIRQFIYQECSVLGWFPSSNSKRQPFGKNIDLQIFYEICGGIFGNGLNQETINKNADLFNVFNAGLNPHVTKVIFTHGELDPFRSIGVLLELNSETPLIMIPGEATGSDMEKIMDYNSPALVEVKKKVTNILTQWIKKENV